MKKKTERSISADEFIDGREDFYADNTKYLTIRPGRPKIRIRSLDPKDAGVSKIVLIFRVIKAWFYHKRTERRTKRFARRYDRKMKRLVDEIRKCTGVQLYGWQLPWVNLARGVPKYYSEASYGRRNGKTTANIFRLLLAGVDVFINPYMADFVIWGPAGTDTPAFMKEDYSTIERREYYIRKMIEYYQMLRTSKNKLLKKRLSRLHYGENPRTEKKV